MPENVVPITFSCTCKGYESRVVLDAKDPQAADALVEWLGWQLRYIQAIKPGDRVEVRGSLRPAGEGGGGCKVTEL